MQDLKYREGDQVEYCADYPDSGEWVPLKITQIKADSGTSCVIDARSNEGLTYTFFWDVNFANSNPKMRFGINTPTQLTSEAHQCVLTRYVGFTDVYMHCEGCGKKFQ